MQQAAFIACLTSWCRETVTHHIH